MLILQTPSQAPFGEICRVSPLKVKSIKDLLEPKVYDPYEVQNVLNKNEDLAKPSEYVEHDDVIDTPQSESKMEDFPNLLVPVVPTVSGRSERSFSTLNETEQQQKNLKSKARTKFAKKLSIGEKISLEQKWKRAKIKERAEDYLPAA